jgi:archaeal type IV pilus assembly protein PilA
MNENCMTGDARHPLRHGATGIRLLRVRSRTRPVPAGVREIASLPGRAIRITGTTGHPRCGRDCGRRTDPEGGVSEVVGEMLMIGLVVVLLSVFAATLFNFIPAERDPSLSIMMSNDTRGNIVLWHKGGDWVRAEDLTVIVGNATTSTSFTNKTGAFILLPHKGTFDLGSNITVHMADGLNGDETVKLVTPHAVIYAGRIGV